VSLPLETFELVKSPEPNLIARGFGCAAVLMLLVLILFVAARMIGGRGPGNLTKRQRQKRVRQSKRDVERFDARVAAETGRSLKRRVDNPEPVSGHTAYPPTGGTHVANEN